MIKFSIIIPVRSINTFLKENIAALKKLDYSEFEVIILTDFFEEYDFNDTRFKSYAVGTKGPGEKRNIGAKNATGDILVFLDDDAYPKQNWLNRAVEIFTSTKTYALGAPAVTPLNAGFLEKCSGRVLESFLTSAGTIYRHIPSSRRLVNDYPTVNLFVTREAFNAVGGFSHEFWPGEDTKLCLDLIKKYNKFFLYDPNPIVYHHRRNLFRPHLKQVSRYGMHRGQFARIFPENSRNISYFIPSGFVLGLLLGPVTFGLANLFIYVYVFIVSMYLGLLFIEGLKAALRDKNFLELFYVMGGIFFTHLVYGINFMIGFIKRPKLQLRGVDKKTGNYLGG